MCLRFVASRLTSVPFGVGGGLRSLIVTFPGDYFQF